METISLKEFFDSLNLTVEISKPTGIVKNNDWPCIRYGVKFSKAGKVFSVDYHLGIDHVNWKKARLGFTQGMSADVESMIRTKQSKPSAIFKNTLEAEAAAVLAVQQNVRPKPEEVLAYVARDATEAAQTIFEDWACELGYDKDSRKAEAIHRECASLYHCLLQLINMESINRLAALEAKYA